MKQSRLFTRVQREAPKDEAAVNARLLERGGFVYKNSAGVYSYLPLGWSVMQKITGIVREEMNAIGGQEVLMPALVEKKYWDTTGRGAVEIGFEAKGKGEKNSNFILGWSHEEVVTPVAAKYVSSYKDLPFAAYQIQTKFRNEPRAKSGLLRGREFIMKDLYSFHADEADLDDYYERAAGAYKKIFDRCGLPTIYTLAAGGAFTSNNTHEFQVASEIGEDTIYVCEKCGYAENKEISKLGAGGDCPKCGGKVEEKKGIEVGNIFRLGTKFSEVFDLRFTGEDGKKYPVIMGCYGIGIGRVMATAVEVHHDEKGIIWPASIAPFQAHIIELKGGDGSALYGALQKQKTEVLYDERDVSAGEKFAESDLLGIPWRFVVSAKLGDKVEARKRGTDEVKIMSVEEAVKIAGNANELHR